MRTSLSFVPRRDRVSRSTPVVRSPEIAVHVCPRSVERKTRCAPMYTVEALCGEMMNGVSQFQRSGGSFAAASGRISFCSPVTRSMREKKPSCDDV
jgi:hypothetical protein